ncbi:MAG: tRNA (adenosine(37)-N6)-threonylcarbamoyltransferase complex ATPase subunit type 1 TsaE [Capsulimonadaceae bacterium]|nr:tRNA (adenosine(37)-N6)-threonylcarbamoyltransferase complex ATPase subunit type 1 TsaE [Capsulimonadaceae bacterium]
MAAYENERPGAVGLSHAWPSRRSAETVRLGDAIGKAASAGDIVALAGDLGAGKTTLVQGIGRGLGLDPRDIVSPTFTIVAEHAGGRMMLYHLDVYRLGSADDLQDLGFDDYLHASDGLIVIEWANLVTLALPDDRLEIEIAAGPKSGERQIHAQPLGPTSAKLLNRILDILP